MAYKRFYEATFTACRYRHHRLQYHMDLIFFPDFFIIGAPRCGTTSLSRYLSKHPDICFSRPKEPHYFSTVSQPLTTSHLQRHYLERFFSHHHAGNAAVGEVL
ncbi:sulfotransferase [Desulfococcus multivorans]|uniref:sulfotransferase n=2 Tax=Desulfococcus multivorans TaxID=897 RepID=UPI00058FE007